MAAAAGGREDDEAWGTSTIEAAMSSSREVAASRLAVRSAELESLNAARVRGQLHPTLGVRNKRDRFRR